jgi:chromosome partitioning protein
MQAMRFNFRTLCRNAAERGGRTDATAAAGRARRGTTASRPCRNSASNGRRNWPAAPPITSAIWKGAAICPNRAWSRPARPSGGYTITTKSTDIREIIGKRPRRPDGASCVRVVFSNLKGGVAKTTMSLHFAQYLAREGYRVLLVDADPQATTTSAFGFIPDLDLARWRRSVPSV